MHVIIPKYLATCSASGTHATIVTMSSTPMISLNVGARFRIAADLSSRLDGNYSQR